MTEAIKADANHRPAQCLQDCEQSAAIDGLFTDARGRGQKYPAHTLHPGLRNDLGKPAACPTPAPVQAIRMLTTARTSTARPRRKSAVIRREGA